MSDKSEITYLREALSSFNHDELRMLTQRLGIPYDALAGQSAPHKAIELFMHIQRHGRLEELEAAIKEALSEQRPSDERVTEGAIASLVASSLDALAIELAALRGEIKELRGGMRLLRQEQAALMEEIARWRERSTDQGEEPPKSH